MTVVALCSAGGAPGVTTTALAFLAAWPSGRPGRRVLLVDADPAGAGVLAGALLGTPTESVGVSLVAADRGSVSPSSVIERTAALDPEASRMVLPGVSEPRQARPLLTLWPALLDVARDLSDDGIDVVVDVGRIGHRWEPTPWISGSDVVALVVRPTVGSAVRAASAIRAIAADRAGRTPPLGILVDAGGYRPPEMADAIGTTDVFALAYDRSAATTLSAPTSLDSHRLAGSRLVRSSRAVVERLTELAPDPMAVAP